MARPIDDITQALRDALAGAIADNKGLFDELRDAIGSGQQPPSGFGLPDPLHWIVDIFQTVALADLIGPPAAGAAEAAHKLFPASVMDILFGYMLGSIISEVAQPFMLPLIHEAQHSVNNQILDPDTAATMTAKGVVDHEYGASEASGGGFDGAHFDFMAENALQYPDIQSAFRLWDLGEISEGDVDKILKRHGMPDSFATQVKTLHRQFLSVADLALGQLRGDIDPAEAQSYANQLGMTSEDFQRFVFNTGEPPGTMQLLEAFRRGDIDQDRLHRGILQSRVRDEWFDVILKLRFERMSVANAVDATVQNHLTAEQGKAAAELAGLHPDDFPVVLETAGEPLSRTEMTELVNRGKATIGDYAQAMRESRLKDKYIPFAEELLVRLIPYRTINTILAHGVKDQKWGIDYLMRLGYTEEDATALVSTSTSSKTSHIKQLTEAQILTLYEAKSINHDQAVDDLGNIGYSAEEAGFILEYTAAKRAVSEQNKAITYLRTGYLNHRITIEQASTSMDRIGVPPDQRDELKKDWEIERVSQVKVLTAGEIGQAVRYGVVAFADAQAKLVEMGYTDNDAKVYLATAAHGVPQGVTIDPIS